MNIKRKFVNKKFLFSLMALSLIVLAIVFDGIISINTINRYQQLTIEKSDLFGIDGKNLKEFELQDDGSIFSKSSDPWIKYVLKEAMEIRSVDITVDWLEPERRYAQVYLFTENGEWIHQNFYIHSGTNTIKFEGNDNIHKFSTLRLDLVSERNCSVNISRVTINNKWRLTLKYHLATFSIIVIMLILGLLIKRNKKNVGFRELKVGITLSFAISFLLCFFAPLDLYFNNKSEFWFDVYTLLPAVLMMFITGILLASIVLLILFLLHKKLYQASVVLLFIALICTYIQGNFLAGNLPPLDGSSIEWGNYSIERLKSIVLWAAVALIVGVVLRFIHLKKMYIVIMCVSACLTGMLMITLCVEGFTTNGYQRKLDANVTIKNQFEMSNTENFIILVLDALDAGTFSNVMEYHQEYEDNFSDFTYYPNTVGAYSYTSRAIPFILSGEWFENIIPFEEYQLNVYKNSELFSNLKGRNYRLGMYEASIPLTDKSIYRFENILEYGTGITSYINFIKSELLLIGFKYAPFDIKHFCVLYPSEFDLLRKNNESASYQRFGDGNLQLYTNLQTLPITYTDQNSFKFIHIEGAHVPYRYDKDVNEIDDGTYEQNVEASITIANAYLEKLKGAGVYDNSVIIIMSDHGYIDKPDHDFEYGRQNPLLMVKGRFEHHDMQISQAPISYDDLQSAYIKLLDGETGDNVFEWKEGDERERRFLFYWYLEEEHMVEYIQTGEASDLTTMIPTGKEYNR